MRRQRCSNSLLPGDDRALYHMSYGGGWGRWLSKSFNFTSALSRIRTCIDVTLDHAPLPIGLSER